MIDSELIVNELEFGGLFCSFHQETIDAITQFRDSKEIGTDAEKIFSRLIRLFARVRKLFEFRLVLIVIVLTEADIRRLSVVLSWLCLG